MTQKTQMLVAGADGDVILRFTCATGAGDLCHASNGAQMVLTGLVSILTTRAICIQGGTGSVAVNTRMLPVPGPDISGLILTCCLLQAVVGPACTPAAPLGWP